MNLFQTTKGYELYKQARHDADAPKEIRDLVGEFDAVIQKISSVTGLGTDSVIAAIDEILAVAAFAPSIVSTAAAPRLTLHKQAAWFKTEPQSFMMKLIPEEVTGGPQMSRRLLELYQSFKNTDGDISDRDAKWMKSLVQNIADVAAERHGVDPFDNYDYLRHAVGEQNASVIKNIYTKIPQNINRGVGTSSLKIGALRALSSLLGAPEVTKGYAVLPLAKRIGVIFSLFKNGLPALLALAKIAGVAGLGYVAYKGYQKLKDMSESGAFSAGADVAADVQPTSTDAQPDQATEKDPAKLVMDALSKSKKPKNVEQK